MGYLIGGSGEDADEKKEIVASNSNEFVGFSDGQLRKLYRQTEKDISRFNNFQMARKLNSVQAFRQQDL